MAGQPFGDRSRSVMRAVLIGLMIAAAVLVLTRGHVLFLPPLLIPIGGLAWRSKRSGSMFGRRDGG
jgi:hypothetical protein